MYRILYSRQAKEGAPHQEAAERLHALHEGDEAAGAGGVHSKRVSGNQPDSGEKGKNHLDVLV